MDMKHGSKLFSIAVVFFLGTMASLLFFLQNRDDAMERFELVFRKQAQERRVAVSRELEHHLLEMEGIRRFYEQSDEVTSKEFKLYTESILRSSCVRTMEWIPRVRQEGRTAFEARTGIRIKEQDADGQLVPARERAEYFPIELAEPFKLNEAALGFDLGSNPERLAALEGARDQGEAFAMELVRLVESPTLPAVFMVVAPVYSEPAKTLEERRRNLRGFVLGMYRMDALAKSALEGVAVQDLAFILEDLDAAPESRLLYRHDSRLGFFDWNQAPDALWKYEERIDDAGRDWRITVFPTDAFIETHFSRAYWWILPVGLLLTLFMEILLRMQLRGRLRAELLVKERTAALVESETKFRALYENAPLSYQSLSETGCYLEVNQGWLNLLGYERDEVIGKRFLDFIHPDAQPYIEQKFAEFKGCGVVHDVHFRIRRKDGRYLDVSLEGCIGYLPDGSFHQTYCVFQDITERKRAEEEKERLLAAIDQAAETIVITDAAGAIQYVNPAFERITGYSPDEAIGQNPRVLQSGEQDEVFYQAMWAVLLRGETWHGRFVNRKKDGTVYTEEATISAVKNSEGQIVNYVAIKEDITEALALEEHYRRAQKMESTGLLAGGIAHEFNNILQAITGFCELILAGIESRSVQREDVVEIQKAARFAGDLTQQLLAFSRKQPREYRSMDLNTVLSNGKKRFREPLDKNFRLQYKLKPHMYSVKADDSQILQVAMNLIVNAKDAMPDGGRITIGTHDLEVGAENSLEFPNLQMGKWVCFSVSDSGCGMDEEQMSHLYDPFYTTKPTGKGSGLGLSVVYGIVKEHGGWIRVDSDLGKGSTFQVFLPGHDATDTGGDGSTGRDAFKGKRILLLEDDRDIRSLAAEILQGVGYEVLEAKDAAEAKQRFAEENGAFDLLFLDVLLPDGNGIELAAAFLLEYPDLPVLLFSGSDDPAVAQRSKEQGFDFIRKPFNLKKLLDTVKRLITAG